MECYSLELWDFCTIEGYISPVREDELEINNVLLEMYLMIDIIK